MKKLLLTLFVLLLTLSLFIACDPTKKPNEPIPQREESTVGEEKIPEGFFKTIVGTNISTIGQVTAPINSLADENEFIELDFTINPKKHVKFSDETKNTYDAFKFSMKAMASGSDGNKHFEVKKEDIKFTYRLAGDETDKSIDLDNNEDPFTKDLMSLIAKNVQKDNSGESFGDVAGIINSIIKLNPNLDLSIKGDIKAFETVPATDSAAEPTNTLSVDLTIKAVGKKLNIKGTAKGTELLGLNATVDLTLDVSTFVTLITKDSFAGFGNASIAINNLTVAYNDIVELSLSGNISIVMHLVNITELKANLVLTESLKKDELSDKAEFIYLDMGFDSNGTELMDIVVSKDLSKLLNMIKIYKVKVDGTEYTAAAFKTSLIEFLNELVSPKPDDPPAGPSGPETDAGATT